jgi:hypothetical protein
MQALAQECKLALFADAAPSVSEAASALPRTAALRCPPCAALMRCPPCAALHALPSMRCPPCAALHALPSVRCPPCAALRALLSPNTHTPCLATHHCAAGTRPLPGVTGPYELHAFSSTQLELLPLPDAACAATAGAWEGGASAGGCDLLASWALNPAYWLRLEPLLAGPQLLRCVCVGAAAGRTLPSLASQSGGRAESKRRRAHNRASWSHHNTSAPLALRSRHAYLSAASPADCPRPLLSPTPRRPLTTLGSPSGAAEGPGRAKRRPPSAQ